MKKLTIGVKVTDSMLLSVKFTSQKTVMAPGRNRNKTQIGIRNPIMTPTTEIRMTERLAAII